MDDLIELVVSASAEEGVELGKGMFTLMRLLR